MNGRKRVEVVAYNPDWKQEFLRICGMLQPLIGDLVLSIEHVGSTAVEGLAAKPIIDIDVVMESYAVFPSIVERLAAAGFRHEGNLGVPGREAFKRDGDDGFMKYHLYVCPQNSQSLREHIALRDWLRTHPEARDAYGALKQANAEQYRYDIDGYIAAKTDFIRGILVQALNA